MAVERGSTDFHPDDNALLDLQVPLCLPSPIPSSLVETYLLFRSRPIHRQDPWNPYTPYDVSLYTHLQSLNSLSAEQLLDIAALYPSSAAHAILCSHHNTLVPVLPRLCRAAARHAKQGECGQLSDIVSILYTVCTASVQLRQVLIEEISLRKTASDAAERVGTWARCVENSRDASRKFACGLTVGKYCAAKVAMLADALVGITQDSPADSLPHRLKVDVDPMMAEVVRKRDLGAVQGSEAVSDDVRAVCEMLPDIDGMTAQAALKEAGANGVEGALGLLLDGWRPRKMEEKGRPMKKVGKRANRTKRHARIDVADSFAGVAHETEKELHADREWLKRRVETARARALQDGISQAGAYGFLVQGEVDEDEKEDDMELFENEPLENEDIQVLPLSKRTARLSVSDDEGPENEVDDTPVNDSDYNRSSSSTAWGAYRGGRAGGSGRSGSASASSDALQGKLNTDANTTSTAPLRGRAAVAAAAARHGERRGGVPSANDKRPRPGGAGRMHARSYVGSPPSPPAPSRSGPSGGAR